MRARSMILAALGATFVLGATAPAFADDWRWREHEWRNRRWHEWREHEWRERHSYYGRPAYVAPPYAYYPPPPVYYAPPSVGLGFSFR